MKEKISERRVKQQFGNSIAFEPLPTFILRVFDPKLKGNVIERTIPQADLSRVDDKLVRTLLTFQLEGVKLVFHLAHGDFISFYGVGGFWLVTNLMHF